MCSTASTIITQKPTVASEKIAARRTRDSVRRASDFVQIAITLVDQLSGLESFMRWVLLFFGSLAAGVLAIVLSLALLLVSLSIYDRYILGITSKGSVGWDPVSIFGRWVIGIPLLIFGLGCSAGFWFLSKRLHR